MVRTSVRLILLGALATLVACHQIHKEDVAGVYIYTPGGGGGTADNVVYRLQKDGTFIRYDRGTETSRGTWGVDTSAGEAALDMPEGEYRLVHRSGSWCWEVRRDSDYRCRVK